VIAADKALNSDEEPAAAGSFPVNTTLTLLPLAVLVLSVRVTTPDLAGSAVSTA
jgi:hypothetical protein